ncbi:hypothetical protein [Methylomonas rapida]|uniref:Uncharacterized protein n=1 Tax=Methylomonas rapida TaxID=2963939 RepID=A0ABY7GQX1_9GAMM|nr:hypothetical protein [Methylomonas rapida]WAR44196.1 hypothetical protein NM686_017735 [Methylomonas rapida]WAR46912.1 hypothetical protein NM686_010480 [Methylomonas rapida]
MSSKQWGHGFYTGHAEGKRDGYLQSVDDNNEINVMLHFWAMKKTAEQLIRLSQSDNEEDRLEVVGLAEAVLLLARCAYKAQLDYNKTNQNEPPNAQSLPDSGLTGERYE